MPAMSKKMQSVDPTANPNSHFTITESKMSLYEKSREERIKENLQRMKSLGIVDLSLKLKTNTPDRRAPGRPPRSGHKSTRTAPLLSMHGPSRRSSRLEGATPVKYCETVKVDKPRRVRGVRGVRAFHIEKGSRPEVYTEEHEKLLGSTEKSWTFFVDGVGKDGKRIYDPINGKTCHQCRQKTLGYRTQCAECNMVQGQFCGDCLYQRYGEHVLEAIENENWICPPCRGICNCSLCRNAKGWYPTGAIYRTVSALGYKSVAHYLIQTKRVEATSEEEQDITNQDSAKRSLSFPVEEKTAIEQSMVNVNINIAEAVKIHPEDCNDFKSKKDEVIECNLDLTPQIKLEVKDCSALTEVQREAPEDNSDSGKKGNDPILIDDEHNKNDTSCQKSRKKRKSVIEPNPDSIGGRLRRRRQNCDNPSML